MPRILSFSSKRTDDWVNVDPIPTLVPWETQLTPTLRAKFFLTGVVFPIVCFVAVALGSDPFIGGLWQSGDRIVYINLLLERPTFLIFLPILLYSMTCLAIWCCWPRTASRWIIFFGLLTGTFLAAVFVILLAMTTSIVSPVAALIVSILLAISVGLGKILLPKVFKTRFSIRYLLIVTTVVAFLTAVLVNVPDILNGIIAMFFLGGMLIIGGAPSLALVTFARVSTAATFIGSVNGRRTGRLSMVAAIAVWMSAFWVTWRLAIDSMMNRYSKLPLTDPNCFVSCAAAYGHRKFIGILSGPNCTELVNMQMCRLKFLEFALATSLPNTHRWIRFFYNRIGPRIAWVCRSNRWLANVTFLVLKPVELLAIGVQWLALVDDQKIESIYRRRR